MLYVRGAHAVDELDGANLILHRFLDKPSPELNNAVAEILQSFNIPDFLNTRTCIDLNGYFGCRGEYKVEHDKEEHDKEEHDGETTRRCTTRRNTAWGAIVWCPGTSLQPCTNPGCAVGTWFRCLVKLLLKGSDITRVGKGKDYIWYEMGFFTHWDHSGHCRMLCIDTPEKLPCSIMFQRKMSW